MPASRSRDRRLGDQGRRARASSGSLAQRRASSASTRVGARAIVHDGRGGDAGVERVVGQLGLGRRLCRASAMTRHREDRPALGLRIRRLTQPTVRRLRLGGCRRALGWRTRACAVAMPAARAADRQREHGPEARRVVLEADRAAVQAGDGGDEAEPQAAAGPRAALLQAHEALQRALAILRRDAGPAVGDGDLDRRRRRGPWTMVIWAALRRRPARRPSSANT